MNSYGFSKNITDDPPPSYPGSTGAGIPSAPVYQPFADQSSQHPHQQYQQPEMSREERFRHIIQTYEISQEFAGRLQLLNNFKIVFLLDDSSSMNSALGDSPLNKPGNMIKATRWNEAEYFATISIEIANLFDRNGCDIHFLNHKPPIRGVKSSQEFLNQFRAIKPNGYTPLTKALSNVLQENRQALNERKLLIIILTDGEPTDEYGHGDIPAFKSCLKNRHPIDKIFISIIACTDQEDSMDYLNRLDKKVKNLDVVDDFRNEKAEVRKARGLNYSFSYGDYVVKSMIGSIDPRLDKADEKSSEKCLIS